MLVAHPDDETAGCGALLQHIAAPIVVFATDGAPKNEYFWSEYGSRSRYRRIREDEARKALAIAGVSEIEFMGARELEGIPDQELHLHLPEAYEVISAVLRRYRPESIVTLAYEGGHPDHDCCSILAAQLGARFGIEVWEFPLYHRLGGRELTYQQFLGAEVGGGTAGPLNEQRPHEQITLELSLDLFAKKCEMLNVYVSQHPFLLDFGSRVERFRPQPKYDYARRPHVGVLNYEAWGWPVKGEDVCAAYGEFVGARSEVTR